MNNLLAQANSSVNQITLTPGSAGGTDFSHLGSITVPGIISAAITLILIVAAIIFFFMLVIGGVRWILSGGDKGQTEAARNQITAALIGLVIVFAAWAIATLVGTLFGINVFTNLTLPSL
jgi:cbb3-type cytochrome oxidase subunit 3